MRNTLRYLASNLYDFDPAKDRLPLESMQEVDRFALGYWDHMRKEEERVFPLAEKMLTAGDWAAIDRAFEENLDPLASERDERDFRKLFSRIVSLAPPPIGVGPAAKD